MTTGIIATTQTPDGPFTLVVDGDAVLASGWTDDADALLALVHPRLRPGTTRPAGASDAGAQGAVAAVAAYYAGDLDAPARVPVRQQSADFRTHVWEVLRTIEPGEVVTYADVSARAGKPGAARAAAGACAMNAAALFVPCHRVVRSDGSLGGFRYGTVLKDRLLAREASASTPPVGQTDCP